MKPVKLLLLILHGLGVLAIFAFLLICLVFATGKATIAIHDSLHKTTER